MKNSHFHILRIKFVLILGLFVCAAANGKTLHVSEKTLADIKQNEQFRTIGEAAALVGPGDTVIIHGGI